MTQMWLGEKPRKPYDVNKVRKAIERCSLRMFDAILAQTHGAMTVQQMNILVDRWQEASLRLMRLVPKEYPTADIK